MSKSTISTFELFQMFPDQESAIDQIRLLKGQRKQREVAAEFGTTQSYVSEIWSGRRRKEVSDDAI